MLLGRHSHIEISADGLMRDQEGRVIEQAAVSPNRVAPAWNGSGRDLCDSEDG